ncbi:MAG: hypothetical protein AABZ64_00900 [Nitrospinota bacterium]
MHDAVELEGAGVPTAVIVTEAFLHEAQVQRAALGMEGVEPVVIAHPLSTLSGAQIEERARQAAPQVKRALLGG